MEIESNCKKISEELRQCTKCNVFIRGLKSNFTRHFKSKHIETKEKFVCKICYKSYTRMYNLRRHSKKEHDHKPASAETISLTKLNIPKIEKPIPWIPPFEARPKFIIKPGIKPWLKETEINNMLDEMSHHAPLISPPRTPTYGNSATEISPSNSDSSETILHDEKQEMTDVIINIYSIYGIFTTNQEL